MKKRISQFLSDLVQISETVPRKSKLLMFEINLQWEYNKHNIPVTPLNDAHFGRVFSFYGAFKEKAS